jgi:hypothetical protein
MKNTDNLRLKYNKSIHFNCKDGDEAFTDEYVLWLEKQLILNNNNNLLEFLKGFCEYINLENNAHTDDIEYDIITYLNK